MEKKAKIGLLRWEKGHVPMGLMQLEGLKGNSTNPESYPFEVDMRHVEGACTETIITHPSQEVCDRFIEIGKEMQAEGVKAITGSCGFNAIFQKQVSEALDIPVFLSSLLQVPFALQTIAPSKKVAVMTAYGSSLTAEHFGYCGVDDMSRIIVLGLENCPEWNFIFEKEDEAVDMDLVEKEIMGTALGAVKDHPEIGADPGCIFRPHHRGYRGLRQRLQSRRYNRDTHQICPAHVHDFKAGRLRKIYLKGI